MCRLALFNAEFAYAMGEKRLTSIFTHLEKSWGGQGNGVAVLTALKETRFKKGISLSAQESSQYILDEIEGGYGLFHTRMASNGGVTDENCHPFEIPDQVILAHNGHIVELSNSLYNYTDTELAAGLIGYYGLPLSGLLNFNGVFIGFRFGKPFIIKSSGELWLVTNKKCSQYCFISEIPDKGEFNGLTQHRVYNPFKWFGTDINAAIKMINEQPALKWIPKDYSDIYAK